jgi:hypothetical protein
MTMNGNHILETKTTLRKKAYWPSVGALSADEFKIYSDEDCEDRGLWLELFCPEDRCLRQEERIKLVDFCEIAGEEHDAWLEAFCPESSCEIFEATDLP